MEGVIWKMKHTIIPTNETISELSLQLTVNIFFCLLHCYIHVTIQASQYTYEMNSMFVKNWQVSDESIIAATDGIPE